MSFQNLRPNNQIYVLDKQGKPKFEKASIISVSMPTPKYGTNAQFGQLPELVVDIVVKVGDRQESYQKLPANLETADSGVKFITTSRESMTSEIMSIKQSSQNVIASVELHNSIIDECDNIIKELNPEVAEREERDRELRDLREQVASMTRGLSELTNMIGELKGEKKNRKE